MGHQVNTRSRRRGPPSSPYPGFPQGPPSLVHWGFLHSPQGPGGSDHWGEELKLKYPFHPDHHSGCTAMAGMRLLGRGKMIHPHPCFPRRLSQGCAGTNPLPAGRQPSEKMSKISKRSPNAVVHHHYITTSLLGDRQCYYVVCLRRLRK